MAQTINYYYSSFSEGSNAQTIHDPIAIIYIEKTDGSPYTGLVYNTSGLVCKGQYYKSGTYTGFTITLVAKTETSGYESGGFKELDDAAFPGWYRFDIPRFMITRLTDGIISFYGVANMSHCILRYYTFTMDIRGTPATKAIGGYIDTVQNPYTITSPIISALSAQVGLIKTAVDESVQENLPPAVNAMQLPPEEG